MTKDVNMLRADYERLEDEHCERVLNYWEVRESNTAQIMAYFDDPNDVLATRPAYIHDLMKDYDLKESQLLRKARKAFRKSQRAYKKLLKAEASLQLNTTDVEQTSTELTEFCREFESNKTVTANEVYRAAGMMPVVDFKIQNNLKENN